MPFDFKKEYKAFYQPSQSTGRVSKKRGNALCRSLYAENEQEGRPSHGWILRLCRPLVGRLMVPEGGV
ncbi:MAG: hypothetical protein M0R06_07230, partial [Sphaerochaeta sp.]|nr:hypothetical protein [Sphaerochaeta sp.]